ncbi:MAG: NAD(P)-dependent alcohol dehydrogenase, partial [Taibaiella sp.]|nr:NAD(P)-dependent alcohol dehydrogenase [Taibaiella sp.]
MKAIVCTKYGPPEVLQLREVAKPTPKHNEVCIKIVAAAVTASDSIIRGFKLPVWHPIGFMMGLVVGFGKPRNPILGLVLAGDIESVGKDVTRFRPGDSVFAFTGTRFGCYAEYTCLPENSVSGLPGTIPSVMTAKPSNVTYEEAVAVPYGGLLALHFLKKGTIQSGQNVLIYGASGAIGTAAVQLAKHHFGAEVTGVCSTTNSELVQSLGADTIIDYTKTDSISSGARYDFVLDAVGKRKHSPLKDQCKNALTPNGKTISVDDGSPKPQLEDLILLKELIEAGKIKPVI